mmetsp:Transcript_8286/g.12033  ORF Transcript_8286/g.12033 Transcript_8286/m.12033 type:complete len:96 (+) Transcript_8286:66-353(+)
MPSQDFNEGSICCICWFSFIAQLINAVSMSDGWQLFYIKLYFLNHHCRALAWKANDMAKHGHYYWTISHVGKMRKSYEPKQHCKAIAKEYGVDKF